MENRNDPQAREQALLFRLATLDECVGFEWLPAAGELFWTAACARAHGADASRPASLQALLAPYDEASVETVQAALSRVATRGSGAETVILLRNDRGRARRLELHLLRDTDGTGAVRVTGRLRDQRGAMPEHQIDALTGVANLSGLEHLAEQAVEEANRHQQALAVLFVDLDYFKQINDTLGHLAGDEVLRVVAQRLRACVRGNDVVGRRGGDEFVVVLRELRRPQDALRVAQKIVDTLRAPMSIASHPVETACSIGVALLGDACPDLTTLMHAADTAMYAAKGAGRNLYRVFNDVYSQRLQRRAEISEALRGAVAREELFLLYQPAVKVSDGRTSGVEALLRWRSADGTLHAPAEFLPVAESSGEIVRIGRWVLNEACQQACAWRARGLDVGRLMLNIAPQQLRDPDFPRHVATACAESGWAASALQFEISGAALQQEPQAMRHILEALRALHVELAFDDFGTGLSNLLHLRRYGIRCLKLDRHFALGMHHDASLDELMRAMHALGRALRMRVVAKGVETGDALAALRELGCDEAQGFHIAHPMPAADVPLWLQSRAVRQIRGEGR